MAGIRHHQVETFRGQADAGSGREVEGIRLDPIGEDQVGMLVGWPRVGKWKSPAQPHHDPSKDPVGDGCTS